MRSVSAKNNPAKRNGAHPTARIRHLKNSSRHRHSTKQRRKLLEDSFQMLNQVLDFRHFLTSGFTPKISDAEIIVMFADVRGFTKYCRSLQGEMQDRKIQNFLASYVKIFTEGLLEWVITCNDGASNDYRAHLIEIRKHVIPSMYKNLGDGFMITWEIPPGMELRQQGGLAHQILNLAGIIQERFCYRFHSLHPSEQDAYSTQVQELMLGFGIAKGHAWRLDFGNSVDYAGSIINLASRLEGCARPSGMVVSYDTSPWIFDQYARDGNGRIGTLTRLKGYDPIKVWVSQQVNITELPGFELLKQEGHSLPTAPPRRRQVRRSVVSNVRKR